MTKRASHRSRGSGEGIVKRAERRFAVVLYEGKQPRRTCESCRKAVWSTDHAGIKCPRCGSRLGPAVDQWRQRWHGPYRTKAEARAARLALLAAKERGEYVAPHRLTVAEYLTRWLAGIDVKQTTRESYRANIENHLVPTLGSIQVQKLTTARINELYRSLELSGRRDGEGLSKKSVRNVHVVLRRALRDALDEGLVARNVAATARPPKQARSQEFRTWSAAQVRQFVEAVADDRLVAAWVLLATTGMRRGEALGLRWRNVDLDSARLSVVESIVPVGYRVEVSTPKTSAGVRWIDLDGGTVSALRAHHAREGEERLALGLGKPIDGDLVFGSPVGDPIHPHSFSAAFGRHVKRAGLPRIRLHDLRHTWASLALAAGIPPKVVSERLGHANVAFTMSVYQHVLPGMQREAAERMAVLILGS